MAEGERLASMETELRAHMKSDDERYARIESNTTDIKAAIRDLSQKIDNAVGRIHERIDTEAAAARGNSDSAHQRVTGLKVWFLSGAGVLLLGIVVFFIAPFFAKAS